MTAPFQESKVRRGPGGLFAAKSAAAGKPTGAWAAGPIRKGTGRKGAPDPRVKALQKQLNALGITDARGRPLLEDGIDGNNTTAAVQKFQRANGLAPTGVVDAALMVKILTTAPPAPKKAATRMRAKPSASGTPARKPAARPKQPPAQSKPTAREQMASGRGQSRLGASAGT